MNEVDCVQGSKAWFEHRLGCVTSSRVADAIAKRKRVTAGKEPEEMACRRDMRFELMIEELTGKATDHYVSEWMQQGRDREPIARAEYEIKTGRDVKQVGFVYHPAISRAGCSPDGILGEDGLLEIKCPAVYTHLGYLMADVIPEDYKPQMLWQMACCERQWCDFVSYSPEVPEEYQLFIKRFERDDAIIAGMELEVVCFLEQVAKAMADLKAKVTP